jgi:hypothetical protein
MKKKDYHSFYMEYITVKSDEKQHIMLRDFMLSLSFEELKGWTDYLFEGIDKQINKSIRQGLTEEDRAFYEKHFAQFDRLSEQIQLKKAA